MKLPLDSEGDHNGNAFPVSSSSSSSSCLGESSPESLRSLSSLSGGRTDSPLDYDMFEVTVVTTVMTETDKMTDVVISKWGPEEESNPDDNDDVSVGKIQTAKELTESNDNSVSVYLDANSEYHQDTWNDNDNLTLALSLTTNGGSHGNNDDLSSGSGHGRRHGSSTPDSDATEIPADDDDEEDGLFLSVSSDMGVCRSSVTLTSSTRQSSGGSAVTAELQTEAPASEDLCKATQTSSSSSSASPTRDAKEVTSPPPEGAERCAVGPKPHTSQPARAAKTKSTTAASPAPKMGMSTAVRPSCLEAKRVSRLDPKIVKAKAGSRSTPSPPKTPNQVLQI